MKEISGKELDSFFKSSLEDFEMEPSAQSWAQIANKLDQKSIKKKSPFIWMAAASIIILMGVGIRFYLQPAEIIRLKPNQTIEQVTANTSPAPLLALPKESVPSASKPTEEQLLAQKGNVTKGAEHQQVNHVQALAKVSSEKNISTDATASSSSIVLNTKAVDENLAEVNTVQPVKVRTVTEQILAEEVAQKSANKLKPTEVLAQSLNDNPTEDGATSGKKLKIRSVGDLVNFVVAKVDKRNDKLIKISKTDESDNEITGINLGLIKFRKSEK